jgi:hypothetical protein
MKNKVKHKLSFFVLILTLVVVGMYNYFDKFVRKFKSYVLAN